MGESHKEEEILLAVVKELVNKPECVSVTRSIDERGVLLTLQVDPSDRGFVIGRQGSMADALRTVIKAIGARYKAKVSMFVHESQEERAAHQAKKSEGVDNLFNPSI